MATKYPQSAQTGDRGVALVRHICADAAGIFRSFETSDIGIDGAIEFLTGNREPSGDIVLVQIKTGSSYLRNGRFYLDGDRDHFESWARYAVPVAGIVCNPENGEARWVDVSDHLRRNPEIIAQGPFSVEAPAGQPFSVAAFPQFSDHFRRNAAVATRVDVTPNLLIRAWHPEDARPTRALLSTIAPDYPNFDNWLTKKFSDARASKKVVAVGDVIAAFSMWQAKDERNIKLQTFIVGQSYRGTAIGQHLLYHELRTWADEPRIERVHVTVASNKGDLIEYFKAFGFRVEGFSANRYPRPAAELVMAKHFLREVIRTPSDMQRLARFLYDRVWGLSEDETRFGVSPGDFAVPTLFPAAVMTVNTRITTATPRILVNDKTGRDLLRHDDESLMREFYPLRLHLARKRYVLIPIYPSWADAMLSTSGPHTPLKLRVDNVYYCFPKLSDLSSGDLVVFYETKSGGGKGAAIGAAIVQEVAIDQPSRLYERFARLGIYRLPDVTSHANARGEAMAIKFSLFEPFRHAVTLKEIINHLGHKTTIQGLTPVPREAFEAIRTSGLS
jgi:ribosomal protein S18 acetylase RimI-like enzyme